MRHTIKQVAVILVIALVMTVALAAVFEQILRLRDFGASRALFVPAPAPHGDMLHVNPRFYAQFFPNHREEIMGKLPYWGFAVPREKAPDSIRIFVFGGSVALGHVPDQAFNASRILECMLAASFPGVEFEIYNVGCFALNSHVMRRAAREAAALSPDFFVVYMGNNEYEGPFGPSRAVSNPPPSSAWIQWQIAFQQFRIVQMIGSLNPPEAYKMADSPVDYIKQAIRQRPDAPGRVAMYDNFAANLGAICDLAGGANAGVILCTLGNNLRRWPPYASENRPDLSEEERLRWQRLYEQGIAHQARADKDGADAFAAAAAAFGAAAALDDTHADMQYRLGQCLYETGDFEGARAAFTRARDYDCFPIRADSFINRRVRETVAERAGDGVLLADTEARFIAASKHGVMGDELFFDAMHVVFPGNHIIAAGVFDAIKDGVAARTGMAVPADAPSLEQCNTWFGMTPYLEARHLHAAIGQLRRYVGSLYDADDVPLASLEERLQIMRMRLSFNALDEALAALKESLGYWGNDFYMRRVMAELLFEAGRTVEAVHEAAALLQDFPDRPDAQMLYERIAGGGSDMSP